MSAHNGSRHYLERLRLALAAGVIRPGDAYVVDVAHDDGCPILSGRGDCTCECEVTIRPLRDVVRNEEGS